MKHISTIAIILLLSSIVFVSIGVALPFVQENDNQPKADGKEVSEVAEQFLPVDNMHHFMEYVCEPSYKGLKLALATEPENRKAWKPFKNHALVLAETAALVATRAPEDAAKAKQWRQISLDVHKSGTALYKSAGNYDEAKKHYGLMIEQCNQCHTVFAKGKHQLKK